MTDLKSDYYIKCQFEAKCANEWCLTFTKEMQYNLLTIKYIRKQFGICTGAQAWPLCVSVCIMFQGFNLNYHVTEFWQTEL